MSTFVHRREFLAGGHGFAKGPCDPPHRDEVHTELLV